MIHKWDLFSLFITLVNIDEISIYGGLWGLREITHSSTHLTQYKYIILWWVVIFCDK